MTTPITSLNLKTTVAPIFSECFDGIYDEHPDQWHYFCNEIKGQEDSDQHVEDMIYGFPAAPLLPDGAVITYETGGETFVMVYKYNVYGLAFSLTEVLVEDGKHINVGSIFSEHLARACIETREVTTANLLNRAFNSSYLGGDGVSLSNTAHPGAFGVTYSNQATASALSQTSLESQLTTIITAVNDRGLPINLTPKILVVPPQLAMQAITLLKSIGRTGTNNNDINPITANSMLEAEPGVVQRLTSTTAWFVTTNAPKGLQIPVRRKLKKGMEGDFETGSLRYKATFRELAWWTNPRGVFCNAGM
jgi:Mu-like prophage major head subunit gpT